MDEVDSLKSRFFPEDSVSLAPSTVESVIIEDGHYAALRGELEADAQDLEAESWSVAVDQQYLKTLHKEAVKRQDVIYELMQTELHHVRTLKLMLHVYMHELRESLQMDEARLDRLFPQVDSLLLLHQHFLDQLKQHQAQSVEPENQRNYCITRLGDILIAQFSGEMGSKMKDSYGIFCSHQSDAVSLYKEQLQTNKKFQYLIRKIGQLPVVRRLGLPECILLVTQRITKYPVLVERIVQNTEADTEEHESLVQALGFIKETISQVDTHVDEYEKAARLRDIGVRLEPKSQSKLTDGRVFRREDVAQGYRALLREGTVNWKAASGRLKDIHAVLLSDVLLLLQEKDQKLIFAVVDNKPSVISLQRLIVREVAHEDKAMFLICASSSQPEMYKIHTSSREERDTWMTHIREAVDSCPAVEEELYGEQEEARAARLRDFQERLDMKDAQIVQSLTEKLQIFADISEEVTGRSMEDVASHSRLLLRGDASDLQQGETLLKGAITEVENLQNLLLSVVRDMSLPTEETDGLGGQGEIGGLVRRAENFGGYDCRSTTATPIKDDDVGERPASAEGSPMERGQGVTSDPQLQDLDLPESLELSADDETPTSYRNSTCSNPFPEAEFFDRVQMLSRWLYSLQAIISQQDSHIELQRASLSERERPARQRGNVLQEQEKQRTLALQREELASFQKLQVQHRQEQARWEKERERHRLQEEAMEAQLLLREEECSRLEERLEGERQELETQRETYQQDLERLRESTQAVEREKERLDAQKKLKKHKTFSNPGHFNFDAAQALPHYASFRGDNRGDDFILNPKLHIRPSLPIPNSGFLELPPEVPPRRESISPSPLKAEVPLHLISTTNQAYKPGVVQQQIPTKLAALSKGKEKSSKVKGYHQRTQSAAASIDMSQMVPIRVSGKEGGSLRAKRIQSPHRILHPDRFNPPEPMSNVKPSQSFSTHKRHSQAPPPEPPPPHPPPFPKDIGKPSSERVIFL